MAISFAIGKEKLSTYGTILGLDKKGNIISSATTLEHYNEISHVFPRLAIAGEIAGLTVDYLKYTDNNISTKHFAYNVTTTATTIFLPQILSAVFGEESNAYDFIPGAFGYMAHKIVDANQQISVPTQTVAENVDINFSNSFMPPH